MPKKNFYYWKNSKIPKVPISEFIKQLVSHLAGRWRGLAPVVMPHQAVVIGILRKKSRCSYLPLAWEKENLAKHHSWHRLSRMQLARVVGGNLNKIKLKKKLGLRVIFWQLFLSSCFFSRPQREKGRRFCYFRRKSL